MSDEVSQFLEQVERLRGQQLDDDEQVRAREREEYLAAKRERQARREGQWTLSCAFSSEAVTVSQAFRVYHAARIMHHSSVAIYTTTHGVSATAFREQSLCAVIKHSPTLSIA